MRRVVSILLAILFVVAGLGAAGLYIGWLHLDDYMRTAGPAPEERIVDIPRGSGLQAIAQMLTETGVIESPTWFLVGARVLQRDRNLKAGEFAFPAEATPLQVLGVLEAGKVVQRRVTVAEGATVREVLLAVERAPSLSGPLPPEPPPEGSLLPETYFYVSGETREGMIGRMQAAMTRAVEELWAGRAEGLPFETPEQAVALASIVEKETGVAAERELVASVFVNRLRRGMRLQSDPTVIYALTGGEAALGRPLLRADWAFEHPYNTYAVDGLPPGPIANPGRAALEAVLRPAETDFLYFVADGSGGHAFARTLDEHNRNVARWRSFQRQEATPAADSSG